jgi:hypothetical protein
MTSQIVLMNQLSMAIASDTLTSRNEASGDTKTYPSMSKIFELGGAHQIAVMHCGCTVLAGAHWRMLVTEWARSLKAPLPTVAAYAENFLAWLPETAPRMGMTDAESIRTYLYTQFQIFRDANVDDLAKCFGKRGHRRTADSDKDFTELLLKFQTAVCTEDPYGDITEESAAELMVSAKVDLIEVFRTALQLDKDDELSDDVVGAIASFAKAALIRYVDSSESVDLTFVGFGSEEFLGHASRRFLNGVYGGKARNGGEDIGSDTPGDYPFAITLAQSRATWPFLHGIDISLMSQIAETFSKAITAKLKTDEEETNTVINGAMDTLSTWLQEEFSNPMFRTLGALGPSALVRYADLLIRMESLRSATLKNEATVGGIVEALSINRMSGVEWHHRIGHDIQPLEESSHILA